VDIFALIKAQMSEAVPFSKHTGVVLDEVGAGIGKASLPQSDTSINHVQSQHAGALFTLGEAASGAAMSGLFADRILKIRPLAANANIAYLKLATGTISATASICGDGETFRSELENEGRVRFDVHVVMANAKNENVAEMKVEWHVKNL